MERRKFNRKELNFIVDYRGQKILQYKMGGNISHGGLFILTDKIEPPGTKADLVIHFGKEQEGLSAQGKVAWARQVDQRLPNGKVLPCGMGIEFVELSAITKDKMQDLIKTPGLKG